MDYCIKAIGYILRFCTDEDCFHNDEGRCPNVCNSKYYVDTNGINVILDSIKNKPIIVGHDKQERPIGNVTSVSLTEDGILIDAIIDEKLFIRAIDNQFTVYSELYTRRITFDHYIRNVFSSFSLSHDPMTWHINHVGLVNIPGRLGTGVTYEKDYSIKPIERDEKKNRHKSNSINDLISAHCVAFLRDPNRRQLLHINDTLSYGPNNSHYINASAKYKTINSHSPVVQKTNSRLSNKPSDMELNIDQMIRALGEESLRNKLNGSSLSTPVQNPVVAPSRKRPNESDDADYEESGPSPAKKKKTDELSEQINATDIKLTQMSDQFISLQNTMNAFIKTVTEKQAPAPVPAPVPEPAPIEVPVPAVAPVEASKGYNNNDTQKEKAEAFVQLLMKQIGQ